MNAPAFRLARQLDPENPWPGLAAFEEEAQDYFHGREGEAEELVRRVIDAQVIVLFGKSGLGKTSLLKAGLFPRLRAKHFLPVYVRLDFGPSAPPFVDQLRDAFFATLAEQDVDFPRPEGRASRYGRTSIEPTWRCGARRTFSSRRSS